MSVPYALHAKTAENFTGSITETDPIYSSSAANGITNSDIIIWNNKLSVEVDGSITNEIELPTGGNDGQVLKTDGSGNYTWINQNSIYGDIKSGIQTTDHSGWVLLDGRTIASLTTPQQTQAANLGLSGNLPDARGKYLSYSPLEGSSFGNNTINLSKANLPTDNFSGTTDYVYNSNTTINPSQYGIIRLSQAGEANTVSMADVPGASVEPDVTSTPIDHKHDFSLQLNTSQTSIDNRPETLNIRMFIYLGE